MKWPEKTRRLMKELRASYQEIEERAGWAPFTLGNAVSQGANIGISKAMSLARALGVTADWLFDDAQDWDARPSTNDSTAEIRSTLVNATMTFIEAIAYASDRKLEPSKLTPYMMGILGALSKPGELTRYQLWAYKEALACAIGAAMDLEGKEVVLPGNGVDKTWQCAFRTAMEALNGLWEKPHPQQASATNQEEDGTLDPQ